MCSTFVYFCVKHKNYLRQDFSYIDLLQQLTFFKRNRNVFAEAAKIQNSYDVLKSLRDHAFSYKKQFIRNYDSNTIWYLDNHFTTP